MGYVSTTILVGAMLAMSACKGSDIQADVPAHISSTSDESRAELLRAVSETLNGSKVTIAEDALTNGSLLVIEPKHLMGRDLRRPEHFRLMLSGADCVLVHQASDTRIKLNNTACAAD